MSSVKSKRSYDSSGRKAQALRSREAVLDAAQSLFVENGYAQTSVAAIAGAADVSVQTVYAAFGGKSGLVRAIYDRGLLGRGTEPAYDRSDEMREREHDPRAIMSEWGRLTAEVASVVSPIRLLMRSAALHDPEIEALLQKTDEERLVRMRHHARFLKARGYLRDGVGVREATDVLYTCSSIEIYDVLVVQRGWTTSRFAEFISDFMIKSLVGAE